MMVSGAKRPAIAAALGRTQNSVTAGVIKLGIQKPSRVRPVWTEADFATLEAGDSMPAIARVLKRNQTDVAAKAFASRQRKPTLLE